MSAEYRLRDDVGRFGIADDFQRLEASICEGGLELAVKAVVGDSVCDHEDGVAGESRFGVGNGMRNCSSCRGVRGESVVWEQGHVQAEESLVDAFLFKGVFRPCRNGGSW